MLTHLFEHPTAPQRVVVIGAGGFVGSEVVRNLRRRGTDVLALSRSDVDLLSADAAVLLAGRLKPGDTVVAVAARAPCRNVDMMIENMGIVRAILAGLSRARIAHLVNVSSDAVYGDEPVPLTETCPTAPGSLHGAMHLAREIAFSTAEVPFATVRPTLIYGAADPHNGYGPNRFLRQAKAGKPIEVFGQGEERRDHVAVQDVAEVIARVVLHRSAGVVNIASGNVHSFHDAATWAIEVTGSKSRIVPLPRSGPMPHKGYRPFDVSALKASFPDIVPVQLQQGMCALGKI